MGVVTRFAPSPTGYVHVGSQRTALYNYIFARQQGGKFILRVEDTDQNRFVEGAVENLLNSLEKLHVVFDAGPGKEDEKGPYFQSQRRDIYDREVQRLMDSGHAYRCFCTSERLDALRKEQMTQQVPTGYDGKCRHLSQEESDERAKQEPFVIRLKTPDEGLCEFKDIVRGDVTIAWSQVDDQVLVKSDGFPTYHLANVVDDHYMEVTHVIRGEEWLPSVPKHLFLYECFGWDAPQMAHLPLLLNADRSKLSKRQGDVAVEDYLNKGYTPDALNNFLALLGWNPGGKNEIYSMDELIEAFDINKITKAGAVFDVKKLDWMNGQYLKNMPNDKYLKEARQWLGDAVVNENKLDTALMAVKTSLTTWKDIPVKLAVFTKDPAEPDAEAKAMLDTDSTRMVFKAYVDKVNKLNELTVDTFKTVMKDVQTETGVKGKNLWMPVRIGLTGEMHGPELGYIVEYLGKDENVKRIEKHLG
jgi:glutamyl-tRNA synthetase